MVEDLVEKSKGVLEILWESGFINTNRLEMYSISKKNPETGIFNQQFCPPELVGYIPYFVEVFRQLNYFSKKLSC